jgi:hypothetical protein
VVDTAYPASQWRRAIYSEWVFTGYVSLIRPRHRLFIWHSLTHNLSVALIIWVFLPESPRWLAQRGKHDRAKAVLRRVNGSVEGYDVDTEYAILVAEIEDGRRLTAQMNSVSILSLFRGTNLRRTLISFGPFGWQQWIGVPVIFGEPGFFEGVCTRTLADLGAGYTSYFFQLAGLKDPFSGTIAVL